MPRLAEQITALSPIAIAIDGTRKVAPRLAKARASGSPTATKWQCPYCLRYAFDEVDSLRHIAVEAVYMRQDMPPEVRARYTRPDTDPAAERIKRVALADGRVRFRFVVDVGRHRTGKRRQLTFTCNDRDQAAAELACILADLSAGRRVGKARHGHAGHTHSA